MSSSRPIGHRAALRSTGVGVTSDKDNLMKGASRMSSSRPIGHRAALRLTGVGITLGLALVLIGPALVAAAAPVTVETLASTYGPATITIEAGTKVTFKNTSTFPHTATADDGSFDTGLIAVGASSSIVLSKAGKFPFYCLYHGAAGGVGQAGTITVTAAAVAATPVPTTKPAAGGTTTKVDPPSSDTRLDVSGQGEGLPVAALAAAAAITVLLALGLDGARRALRRRAGG